MGKQRCAFGYGLQTFVGPTERAADALRVCPIIGHTRHDGLWLWVRRPYIIAKQHPDVMDSFSA